LNSAWSKSVIILAPVTLKKTGKPLARLQRTLEELQRQINELKRHALAEHRRMRESMALVEQVVSKKR
jgi:uncharacterized protein YoxC